MVCIPSGTKPVAGGRRPCRCTERRVIAVALAWPTCGPQWYSDQLARDGVSIAPLTIWRLLRRQQLGTGRARLAVLEQCSAATTGLLTERTAKPKPTRHVEAAEPGALLSLDTFYVGKPKGVGKVWQITACDASAVLQSRAHASRLSPQWPHTGDRLQRCGGRVNPWGNVSTLCETGQSRRAACSHPGRADEPRAPSFRPTRGSRNSGTCRSPDRQQRGSEHVRVGKLR
jgi:hypothetical protein